MWGFEQQDNTYLVSIFNKKKVELTTLEKSYLKSFYSKEPIHSSMYSYSIWTKIQDWHGLLKFK